MKNVVAPRRTVSFEDALRNLAAKLTGTPANELPRTQEGVVQYMAENVPSVDEMTEAITQEVIARLSAKADADDAPTAEQDTPVEQDEAPTEQEAPAAKNSGKSRKSTKN